MPALKRLRPWDWWSPYLTKGGGAATPITILGASALAWWTADRADLITLSGSEVTSWKDVVAAYDAAQGTSARRPLYSATSYNGAPGVTFDGTDDRLEMASQPFPSAANPCEIWVITEQQALAADTSERAVFGYGGGSAATARRASRSVNTGTVRAMNRVGTGAGSGAIETTTPENLGRHVMRARIDATTYGISIDGNTEVTGSIVPATGSTRAVIGATDALGGFWQGVVRDVVVTGQLSAGQVTALLAWALARRLP